MSYDDACKKQSINVEEKKRGRMRERPIFENKYRKISDIRVMIRISIFIIPIVLCPKLVEPFSPLKLKVVRHRYHAASKIPTHTVSQATLQVLMASPMLKSSLSSTEIKSATNSSTGKVKNAFWLSGLIEQQILRLGKAGETDKALDLYWSLWENNREIKPRTRHMNMAIDACARAQPVARMDDALHLFEFSVEGGRLQPNQFTLGSLLFVCARAGDCIKAKQILQEFPRHYNIKANGVVYSTAMAACERATPPQPSLALEILREASSKGISVGVVGYNAAVSAFAKAGDASGAVKILQEMETGQQQEIPNGDMSTSETLQAASDSIRNPLIPHPDLISYATVMAAYERSQQWHNVIKYGEDAKRRGFTLDGIAYSSLLKSCQQLGLAKEAIAYIEEMKQVAAVTSSSPVRSRSTHGREFRGAKQELLGPDSVAYGLAISACSNAGKLKDALKLLEEMKKEAPMQGENSSGHVMAYTAAITGCTQGGKWRKAFQLLNAMIQDSYPPNSLTYSAVISSCAEAISLSSSDKEKDWLLPMEASLGLFDEIKQQQPHLLNIQIYNAAIRVYAEAQNPEKAFQLFHEAAAASIEPDIFTFGCLMTACERAGKMDHLVQVFQHMKVYNMTPNEIIYGAAISCCRKNAEVRAFSSF